MSFFETVKGAVKKTSKEVVKVSGDAVEFTKLKFKIADIKDKINESYKVIGIEIYKNSEGADADTDLIQEKCDYITSLKSQLSELNEQLSQITNKITCFNCGTKNSSKSVFCSKCGEKINETDDM